MYQSCRRCRRCTVTAVQVVGLCATGCCICLFVEIGQDAAYWYSMCVGVYVYQYTACVYVLNTCFVPQPC
jgi:hypothetical protein